MDTVLAWLQAKIAQVLGPARVTWRGTGPMLLLFYHACMRAWAPFFVLAATRQSVPCMQDFNVLRYKKGGMSCCATCMHACMHANMSDVDHVLAGTPRRAKNLIRTGTAVLGKKRTGRGYATASTPSCMNCAPTGTRVSHPQAVLGCASHCAESPDRAFLLAGRSRP